jgi:hypothetical protein
MEILSYINDIAFNTYTIKQLIGNKIAVHVPTLKEFKDMQEIVKAHNKDVYIMDDSIYNCMKEETCLNIENWSGDCICDIQIEYCDKQWYIDNGYKIISMEDIR